MERDQLTRAYSLALDDLAEFDLDADSLAEWVDLDIAASGHTLDRLSDEQKMRLGALVLAKVVEGEADHVFDVWTEVEVFVSGVGRSSDLGPTITYSILVRDGDDGELIDVQVTTEIAASDPRLAAEIDLRLESAQPQPRPFLFSDRFSDEERSRLVRRPHTREYRCRRVLLRATTTRLATVDAVERGRSRPRERHSGSRRSSRGSPDPSRPRPRHDVARRRQ